MRSRSCISFVFVILWSTGCGSDPAPIDGGWTDVTPTCPSDCDDGVFCNGAEECAAAACTTGSPPCSTDERCDEALARCFPDCGAMTDVDGDGADAIACGGDDCDDSDPARHPGSVEICDSGDRDEDCDPETFGERDRDGDGANDLACCNGTACGTDCNDLAPDVRPGGTEVCNRVDDDCDGAIDEGVQVDGFADADRDGRGDRATPMRACAGQNGFTTYDDDCNDANLMVHGAQTELCDTIDNDCDGVVDENALPVTWYPDADGDGFGSPLGAIETSCALVPGHSILPIDCDDRTAARSPRTPELCNAIDDDCSDGPDHFVSPGNAEDDDRDGIPDIECDDVVGPRDCDDLDPDAADGRQEICNGRDDDCDGVRDEGCVDCVIDAHCSDGARCVGNVCEPQCGSMGMCPAGSTCCGGACVDTTSNGSHCGGCGAQCVVFSAFPACEAGECVVSECISPFESCDGVDANGCEIDTTRSTLHCGSCGAACALPHASATCAARACRVATCNPGWADCNGIPDDGCEVDLLSDEANCGACARACVAERGASALECVAARCRITSCEPGRSDCNNDLADGCEVAMLAPSPACINVLRGPPSGGYPAITVSAGSPISSLNDGRVCQTPFDFRSPTTIDVDLGPGEHSVSRAQMLLTGSAQTGSIHASADGVTYTQLRAWDTAVVGGVATYDYPAPTNVRYLRFVPNPSFTYPWLVMEIEIYECP